LSGKSSTEGLMARQQIIDNSRYRGQSFSSAVSFRNCGSQ
jgi:hypothetical protein